jgi:hypothetical protein
MLPTSRVGFSLVLPVFAAQDQYRINRPGGPRRRRGAVPTAVSSDRTRTSSSAEGPTNHCTGPARKAAQSCEFKR